MAAPPPPSRFNELVDMLKAEYDRVSSENQGYKDIRHEWNRKIEEQATELTTMLAEFRDLERKHAIVKEQYENEILRLKGQSSISQPAVPQVRAPLPLPGRSGVPQGSPGQPSQSQQPNSNPPYSPNSQPPHALPTLYSGPLSHQLGQSTATAQQQQQQQQQPNGNVMSSPQQQRSNNLQLQIPQQHSATNNLQPGVSMTVRSGSGTTIKNNNITTPPSMSLIPSNGPANSNGTATIATTGVTPGGINSIFKKESNNGPLSNTSPSPNNNNSNSNNQSQSQPPISFGPHPSSTHHRIGAATATNSSGGGGVGSSGGNPQLSGGITGGSIGGGPSNIGMGPGNNGISPTHGEDWAVYQGRSPNGSQVNMKVNLQSSLSLDSVVCCVRYSWDGQYLATGSNRAAHIFNAATGQLAATFSKDTSTTNDRDDNNNNTTNPINKNNNNTSGNSNSNNNCSSIPSTGGATGTDSYVRAVCFSPDGQWLITGAEDHVVKVWDVNTRKVKHLLRGHGTDIYSVDASPNGQFIISGSGDKKAKLWSLENGKLLNTLGDDGHSSGPTDGITSVSVSPSNHHVAAGSLDKIVRVWEVETGRLLRQFEGHKDSVYSVAFSPDGRLVLSGSLDKTLKLWDLAAEQNGQNQCRLSFSGHKDFVLSVAFSPNSRWLISGSKDRSVQFWDPRQSAMSLMLHGHKNSVISIAHNPASKALATGSGDCRARTWVYS